MRGQTVRLTAAVLTVILSAISAGCAVGDQAKAVRASIPSEQVPGINRPHSIVWVWPEPAEKQFSDVQARRFYVSAPDNQTATNLYVVEGKDAKTGQWRVIYAAKQMNDQWVPVQLGGSASPIASAR